MTPQSSHLDSKSQAEPGYIALTESAGVVDLSNRTQLELTGEDRATFLHNFCTNAVRPLKSGSGCEAFITDARGHTIGHALIFCGEKSLIIESVAGQAERLINHLSRYIIRERVEIVDRSAEWGELLVAGPKAAALLESLAVAVPGNPMGHAESQLLGEQIYVRHVGLAGCESYLIVCRVEHVPNFLATLVNSGAVRAGLEAFEIARMEAGTPLFGIDITDKNLPQEVNRDARAISFTKGCYLGQETVARIDALGHVNKLLVGVRVDSTTPLTAGMELKSSDASVGVLTSVVWSPRLQNPLGLGYVRRGHNAVGTKLESANGPATVVALPL